MTYNNETFSDRLKKLIETSSYSRTEIAEKAGITKQALYKYENAIVTNIPSDKIEKLAEVLNTTPAYLMGWQTEKEFIKKKLIHLNDQYDKLMSELNLTDDQKRKVYEFARAIVYMEQLQDEKNKHSD